MAHRLRLENRVRQKKAAQRLVPVALPSHRKGLLMNRPNLPLSNAGCQERSAGEPQPLEPLAVRPKQAARLIGVSERTLFNLTKRGELRAVRLGTAKQSGVLYPVAELRRFLAERLSGDAADSAPQGTQG